VGRLTVMAVSMKVCHAALRMLIAPTALTGIAPVYRIRRIEQGAHLSDLFCATGIRSFDGPQHTVALPKHRLGPELHVNASCGRLLCSVDGGRCRRAVNGSLPI